MSTGVGPAVIERELSDLGRDDGLTPEKLDGTKLLALVARPPGWQTRDALSALYRLIIDTATTGLADDRARAAVRVTLNLDRASTGRGKIERQVTLAHERNVHPDTVRAWFGRGISTLTRRLLERIDELNASPASWEAWRSATVPGAEDEEPPDHSFERIESTWWLKGRVGTEMISSRWLVAEADGVSRYRARAWYFSDPDPRKYEIVPNLNCAAGPVTQTGRGLLLADLIFPKPLLRKEKVFFSYRTLVHSDRDVYPVFQHECRSGGVQLLVFRVQFDQDEIPSRVWRFGTRDDAYALVRPAENSDRYIQPTALGFVEQTFRDCKPGLTYGIAWQWPEVPAQEAVMDDG